MGLRRLAACSLVGGLLIVHAIDSGAQCTFNTAHSAKGGQFGGVRAYDECVPGSENTSTNGDALSCAPVVGPSTYSFFPTKGGCQWKIAFKKLNECSTLKDSNGTLLGLRTGPGGIFKIKAQCKGILKPDGLTPINFADDGWTLRLLYRATIEIAGVPMTVIDFPVSFNFDEPANGQIKLSSNSAEALVPLVGTSDACFPSCSSITLVEMRIVDPNSVDFASRGGAVN